METKLKEFLNIIDTTPLKEEEKNKLKALWKDAKLLDRALTKIKNNLTNKMLTDDLSPEFVKWAIYTFSFLRGMSK